MSQAYINASKLLDKVEPGAVFVEIGSDRYEGSTLYFAELAARYNTFLHTVDIVTDAQERLKHPNIVWHTGIGSKWAKHVWPRYNLKIALLYLDNFDWCWDTLNKTPRDLDQANWYKQRFDIDLNNVNCQQEHLEQAMSLLPWLTDNCVIVLDDTYMVNETWTGKSGPVVFYLRSHGFQIVAHDRDAVILSRGNTV